MATTKQRGFGAVTSPPRKPSTQALRLAKSEAIHGLTGLEITTASDGTGQNCLDRALAALTICPDARAVIGSLILRGGRCLRSGAALHSCKPWGHHVWLVQGERGFQDPSIRNLERWAQVQEIELPGPLAALSACSVLRPAAQIQIVQAVIQAQPLPADLIYLPGLIFSTDLEELPTPPAYIHAWGKVAKQSIAAGGFDLAELIAADERVGQYMAEPPAVRSTPVAIQGREVDR